MIASRNNTNNTRTNRMTIIKKIEIGKNNAMNVLSN